MLELAYRLLHWSGWVHQEALTWIGAKASPVHTDRLVRFIQGSCGGIAPEVS